MVKCMITLGDQYWDRFKKEWSEKCTLDCIFDNTVEASKEADQIPEKTYIRILEPGPMPTANGPSYVVHDDSRGYCSLRRDKIEWFRRGTFEARTYDYATAVDRLRDVIKDVPGAEVIKQHDNFAYYCYSIEKGGLYYSRATGDWISENTRDCAFKTQIRAKSVIDALKLEGTTLVNKAPIAFVAKRQRPRVTVLSIR